MTDRYDREGRRPGRRNIEFSDRDFDSRPELPDARGLRDEHWDADRDYSFDGEYSRRDHRDDYQEDYDESYDEEYDDRYDEESPEEYVDDRYYRDEYPRRYPREESRSEYRDESREESRDSYRDGYRDGYRDNDSDRNSRRRSAGSSEDEAPRNMSDNKVMRFVRRHPLLMNLVYIVLATVVVITLSLWFLDFWTFHGQEKAVPDVKGQSYEVAQGNIVRAGLRAVITDSVYDSYARPGTVVEQVPVPLARIKRGGTVYLTVVAFSPKMVTIPDIFDVSERQAKSMLEGLGIKQIMVREVPSEYAGLVMGARFNGVELHPGAKVPVTAVITIEVGAGMADTWSDSGELVDSVEIEEVIETLNIE